MKRISTYLFLAVVVVALLLSRPMTQPAQARTVRLFIIGNSFSQNATQYLPQLAREAGHELILGRAEAPGHSLQQHWAAVEATEANPTDAKGKIYAGKSLRDLLSAGTWDVVTIQQASVASSYLESYRPFAQNLRDFIKRLQPHAEVVLHQTWAYRNDAPAFGVVAPSQRAQSDREMWEKLHVAYYTIAADLGLRVIPTGDAFWRVASNPQTSYKKDANFDFANPVFPNLPDQTNSLNAGYRWENQTKFGLDANHANEAGKYLGSLVWFGFLFGESPEKVAFAPAGVPASFAASLRQAAALTLGLAPQNPASVGMIAPTIAPQVASQPTAAPQPPRAVQATTTQGSASKGITSAQGQGADTSVRGGSYSARAFGAHPILRVRNTSVLEHARKTYVRFDLSQLAQPAKAAKNAELRLTVAAAENNTAADKVWTFQVYGLKDGVAGEDWSEGTMAWDNAPANDMATASTLTGDAILLGTFTLTGKGEEGKTVSVSTPELVRFVQSDTDGKATCIITRREVGDGAADNVIHVFAAKEQDALAPPTLNVGF